MARAATASTAGWTIEPLPAEELDRLAAFQVQAARDQFHAHYFTDQAAVVRRLSWQYEGRERDGRLPVWVIRQGRDIAGQVSLAPQPFLVDGRAVTAAWCQDLLVAPDYRGRGAGLALLREMSREVQREFTMLLAGGTNAQSHPLFSAAGFRDLGELPRWVGLPLWSRVSCAADHDLTIERCAPDDARMAAWWRAGAPRARVHGVRDPEWLTRRFRRHPHWSYQAWIALRQGQVRGALIARHGTIRSVRTLRAFRIVELAAELGAVRPLVGAAVRDEGGTDQVMRCDLQAAPEALAELGACGLFRIGSNNRVMAAAGADLAAACSSLEGWFLSAADTDFDLYDALA